MKLVNNLSFNYSVPINSVQWLCDKNFKIKFLKQKDHRVKATCINEVLMDLLPFLVSVIVFAVHMFVRGATLTVFVIF
uniref:Uncharacterized protein n=1 Tax=Tetranychus urticae TaxID=32264 RepID=T1K147_TETUR